MLERVSSLRKQIQKTVFTGGDPLSVARCDRVLEASREMAPMVDDVVACLDTVPLEVEECHSILTNLCKSIRVLLSVFTDTPEEISDALDGLNIGTHPG